MSPKTHLVIEDRKEIESMHDQNISFTQIGKTIGKSSSTISREVKAHRVENNKTPYGRISNRCMKSYSCSKRDICAVCKKKGHPLCRTCNLCNEKCNEKCNEYEEATCPRLTDAPFVCNGCDKIRSCSLRKKFYRADKAQKSYKFLLSEARSGFNITEEEIQSLNSIMTPLIRKGQSISHVIMSNSDSITVSARSIYTYTRAGLLEFRNWDLPRVIKMKPRKSKSKPLKVDKKCRVNRTWQDYQAYQLEHFDIPPVEIDSVIGSRGGKALLTIIFSKCAFMLAFLRERNDSQSVIDAFNLLYSTLGADVFKDLFPVMLADNGSEFSNPAAIEFTADGSRRTRLFYCDPQAPFQKPHVEEDHTLIRRILPKGSSFDSLTQEDINLVMSHVNSYKRASLNGKSPFETFTFLYGESAFDSFPYKIIAPDDIVLLPFLLTK